MQIKIVSLDISMSNLGIAKGIFDTETKKLTITDCLTVCPLVSDNKQVRQNSKDVVRSRQLLDALVEHTKEADMVCAEIPVGSQTARAMASYGICVALIAVVQKIKPTFIEVSPNEVKMIVGSKSATKKEVIQWVQSHHPEAPLETFRGAISLTKAEHQADAIVAIHAAMQTPVFNSLKTVYEKTYEDYRHPN